MWQSYRLTCSLVSSKDILSSISFFLFLSSSSFSFCSIILSTSSSSEINNWQLITKLFFKKDLKISYMHITNNPKINTKHWNATWTLFLVKIICRRFQGLPCLFRSLSLIMCLCKARAMALDSLGLSRRAGMMVGIGGASWRCQVKKNVTHRSWNINTSIYIFCHYWVH